MTGKSKLLKKKRLVLDRNRLLRKGKKDSRVVNAETSSGCIEQDKKATSKIENEDIITDNTKVIEITFTEQESCPIKSENEDSVSARKKRSCTRDANKKYS